jgi:hypothetical protein
LEQVWRRFEKTEESLDSTTSTSTSNVDIGLIGSVGIVDSSESTVKSRPNTFQIFSRSFRFFRLSWEASTLKNYQPEDSKRSGSRRIEFSSKSTTVLM